MGLHRRQRAVRDTFPALTVISDKVSSDANDRDGETIGLGTKSGSGAVFSSMQSADPDSHSRSIR